MATKRISELASLPSVTGNEFLITEQDGITYKGVLSDLVGLNQFSGIGDLTTLSPEVDTDEFLASKAGVAYKATLKQISDYKRYGRSATVTGNGSIDLDLTVSDLFIVTLTGDVTIGVSAFNTPPMSFMLRLKQDGTGGRVVTFSSAFKFPNNEMFTLGTNPGDIEWFVGHHIESGVIELLKADGPFNLSV